MRVFLEDFGLVAVGQSETTLFMRGADAHPYLYRCEKGDAGFAALGVIANTDDLERLSSHDGVPVVSSKKPGGGLSVELTDPDGFRVEVVANQTASPSLALHVNAPVNTAHERRRKTSRKTIGAGPSQVFRLGHVVLDVADFEQSLEWYQSRFGLLVSDYVEAAPGHRVGAFLRCDLGEATTDHHSLFLLQNPAGPRFNHAAFEVADMDDLMRGHEHLKSKGAAASWGVGRHILGSQIFDYWRDPWGHELEHWTDGDLLAASDAAGVGDLHALMGTQWGPEHPMLASLKANGRGS